MTARPKLCQDCLWMQRPARYADSLCLHAVSKFMMGPTPNVVTGGPSNVVYVPCYWMRAAFGRCGPDAQLFEPKEKTQ